MSSLIGTQAESSLHAALKRLYLRPGDKAEVQVGGYIIDVLRASKLIEIQTGNFSALKDKLRDLLGVYRIELIYPIAQERWILRETDRGDRISRRKSPRRGKMVDLFQELVYIPEIARHPNFSLEILLIREEQVLRDDGQGSWRRKGWSVVDRRLLDVVGSTRFSSPFDYLALLPDDLPSPFTTRELADGLGLRPRLAGKMAYTLLGLGALTRVGKRGRAWLYIREERLR